MLELKQNKKKGNKMFVTYKNYKGGINNLIVVSDNKGRFATSLISIEQAIKNYKRKIKRG